MIFLGNMRLPSTLTTLLLFLFRTMLWNTMTMIICFSSCLKSSFLPILQRLRQSLTSYLRAMRMCYLLRTLRLWRKPLQRPTMTFLPRAVTLPFAPSAIQLSALSAALRQNNSNMLLPIQSMPHTAPYVLIMSSIHSLLQFKAEGTLEGCRRECFSLRVSPSGFSFTNHVTSF